MAGILYKISKALKFEWELFWMMKYQDHLRNVSAGKLKGFFCRLAQSPHSGDTSGESVSGDTSFAVIKTGFCIIN